MQVLFHTNGKDRLEIPAVAYRETDWEFLKRLAGRKNTVLVPDIRTPNLHFGLPEGKKRELPENLPYEAHREFKGHMLAAADGSDPNCADFISHKDMNISANGSVDMSAGGSVLFSAPSNILFSQTKTIRDASGKRFTIPESSFSLENETHVRAKAVNHRGLSRTPQTLFPNSLAAPSARAEDGRAAKGLVKREKGFNLGGLLNAAVAVCAVCAFAVAVAATGANPALVLKAAAALLLLPPLLLVGCGKEEERGELPEPESKVDETEANITGAGISKKKRRTYRYRQRMA